MGFQGVAGAKLPQGAGGFTPTDSPTNSPDEPSLRRIAVDRLLRDVIHADGGPLIHNGSEDEQRSFDSTCRKFHRFLTQLQR